MRFGEHHERYDMKMFDCESFSCFEEKEILFFGGETVLKIKGITQFVDGWKTYDVYLKPMSALKLMMTGCSITNQPITKEVKVQRAMSWIFQDVLRTTNSSADEKISASYMRQLMYFQFQSATNVRLIYDELLMEYQWLRCILRMDGANTLSLANIAVLWKESEEIVFLMRKNYILSQSECDAFRNGLSSMFEMGLNVNVCLKWPSAVPKFMDWNLHYISAPGVCTNLIGNSIMFEMINEDVGAENVDKDAVLQTRITAMIEALQRNSTFSNVTHVMDSMFIASDRVLLHGICREMIQSPIVQATSVFDLISGSILRFYAKPLHMHVVFEGQLKSVYICPIRGWCTNGWMHLISRINEAFGVSHENGVLRTSIGTEDLSIEINAEVWYDSYAWDEHKTVMHWEQISASQSAALAEDIHMISSSIGHDVVEDAPRGSVISNIDIGLKRWWQHCGRGLEYDEVFKTLCEDGTCSPQRLTYSSRMQSGHRNNEYIKH